MVSIAPCQLDFLSTALNIALTLSDEAKILLYAKSIVTLKQDHSKANQALADVYRARRDNWLAKFRLGLEFNPSEHLLVRLECMHKCANDVLVGNPIDNEIKDMIDTFRQRAEEIDYIADVSEFINDRLMYHKVFLDSLDFRTPYLEIITIDSPITCTYYSSRATQIDMDEFKHSIDALKPIVVFYVSADVNYIATYARSYVLSVLRSADIPFVAVVHVIGGRDAMVDAISAVGVCDLRVFFIGDDFNATAVTTICYAEPPTGAIKRPIAHYQSTRFQVLGMLLDTLEITVLVSDIDCILERGVRDLLDKHRGDDVVFNEARQNHIVACRLTANLLLLNPTRNARLFSAYLRKYLNFHLRKSRVIFGIDQIALFMARQYMWENEPKCNIGYFDTSTDINNVMLKSYKAHPFRFLSLFHGFDMGSLDADLR